MSSVQNWMNDPKLIHIAKEKLEFLEKMLFESKKYQGKELFPFFMSLAVKAKQQNISYTQEELDIIIPVLKKYASPEEVEKMNKVIKMFRKSA